MKINFQPFTITTEGCIYDALKYSFKPKGGGDLPLFITQDKGNISINVSTSVVDFKGIYSLELIGSFNPYLYKVFPFTISTVEFVYPNQEAPKFTQNLRTPLMVTYGHQKDYLLPRIKDIDDDPFTVSAIYTGGKAFPPAI
jgi:hypothetical protein